MEENKPVETGENTEQQTGFDALPKETQEEIKRLRKENEKRRKELDDYKTKLESLDTERKELEEKKLTENNEFKTLFEKTKTEKSELELQYKSISERLKQYEEVYERERLELLEKLPADKQEKFKNLDKSQLQEILSMTFKTENSVGAKNVPNEGLDVMKITAEEWAKMSVEHPEQYTTLKTKHLELLRKERLK